MNQPPTWESTFPEEFQIQYLNTFDVLEVGCHFGGIPTKTKITSPSYNRPQIEKK